MTSMTSMTTITFASTSAAWWFFSFAISVTTLFFILNFFTASPLTLIPFSLRIRTWISTFFWICAMGWVSISASTAWPLSTSEFVFAFFWWFLGNASRLLCSYFFCRTLWPSPLFSFFIFAITPTVWPIKLEEKNVIHYTFLKTIATKFLPISILSTIWITFLANAMRNPTQCWMYWKLILGILENVQETTISTFGTGIFQW